MCLIIYMGTKISKIGTKLLYLNILQKQSDLLAKMLGKFNVAVKVKIKINKGFAKVL